MMFRHIMEQFLRLVTLILGYKPVLNRKKIVFKRLDAHRSQEKLGVLQMAMVRP